MIIATDEDVRRVLAQMLEIRQGASRALLEMFGAVMNSDGDLRHARAALITDVGFALFTPLLDTRHRLVVYVREYHRRKHFGTTLVREATRYAEVIRDIDLAKMVWHGNELSHRFWNSVGVAV